MHTTLLHNQHVIILLFGWGSTLLVLGVGLFLAVEILRGWSFESLDERQYRLERHSWLLSTLVGFGFGIEVILLPYFVFTLDSLSHIVPGAMCGAGVISYNDYGLRLLGTSLALVAMMALWLLLDRYDIQALYRWIHPKMWLHLILTALSGYQLWLGYHFFEAIDIHEVVHCCSTLYGLLEGMNPLPFGLKKRELTLLFVLLYALIVTSYLGREGWLFVLAVLLFGYVAYYSILYLFGPYIYEQPNHNCPFCMMQQAYHYVGYLVWGLLFVGLFLGVWSAIAQRLLGVPHSRAQGWAVVILGLFVLLLVGYVGHYYFTHHTLLQAVTTNGMMMEM